MPKPYTKRADLCTIAEVERLNITLDPLHASKLAQMAERVHVQPGTLARSLLSTAIDDADPDSDQIADLLDRIPGAWESIERGLEQDRRGEGIPLDVLKRDRG